jgi:hypothetical protein
LRNLALALREVTEREATWFFDEVGGKVPQGGDPAVRAAAATIDARFKRISSFQRGVLALRFAKRSWPDDIQREFGVVASVAVRMECAQHPAVGTTDDVEAAAVERLTEIIRRARIERARRGGRLAETLYGPELTIQKLFLRAARYVSAAVRALAAVREDGPCVVSAREAP